MAVVRLRRMDAAPRWSAEALVSLPARTASPGVELARRGGLALVLLALVVTPLRIGFLVLLAATTLEVLANLGRQMYRDRRWRRGMRNHVVVVG